MPRPGPGRPKDTWLAQINGTTEKCLDTVNSAIASGVLEAPAEPINFQKATTKKAWDAIISSCIRADNKKMFPRTEPRRNGQL